MNGDRTKVDNRRGKKEREKKKTKQKKKSEK